MKELYPLFGIATVLNTPFDRTGKIDTDALRKNVRYALNAEVAGFLVPAMAAEVYKLSAAERIAMLDTVLQEVNGRVPVIAGAGETDPARAAELLRQYLALGCKEVLFQIPYQNEQQFRSDFLRLAELQPEVIMLQDWDAGGYGLPDELILRLFDEVPAFRCLKVETIPAGVKYSRILELTAGRLHVSGGWAVSQMMEGLKRGVHAFMPTGLHYTYTRIYREYVAGNHTLAGQLFSELLPILSFSNQHLDISIHFFKQLLFRQGVYPTPDLRSPFLPFDEVHQQIADKLIRQAIALEERNSSISF